MRYKNIVFDFGNVIGSFDADYILDQYVHIKEDFTILANAIHKMILYSFNFSTLSF